MIQTEDKHKTCYWCKLDKSSYVCEHHKQECITLKLVDSESKVFELRGQLYEFIGHFIGWPCTELLPFDPNIHCVPDCGHGQHNHLLIKRYFTDDYPDGMDETLNVHEMSLHPEDFRLLAKPTPSPHHDYSIPCSMSQAILAYDGYARNGKCSQCFHLVTNHKVGGVKQGPDIWTRLSVSPGMDFLCDEKINSDVIKQTREQWKEWQKQVNEEQPDTHAWLRPSAELFVSFTDKDKRVLVHYKKDIVPQFVRHLITTRIDLFALFVQCNANDKTYFFTPSTHTTSTLNKKRKQDE